MKIKTPGLGHVVATTNLFTLNRCAPHPDKNQTPVRLGQVTSSSQPFGYGPSQCGHTAHQIAHHVQGWPATRRTDINDLTLAYGPDNRLAEKGWTTPNNARGDTEWLPPPQLDYGQPRINTFHHPEKMQAPDDHDP
jgi:hypothetical protein